ncbi:MAG: hypothetical protein GF346_10205 [Candidatus Eisenbacteria bacterium]|nr:hypothetical protein [Candidatus Latescibacterota bacterium]MBD3302807.1 hypothetical protein [Candidatus Eisenbacteria bacterium]
MSKSLLIMDLSCPQCAERLTDGCKVRLDAYIKESGQHGVMALSAAFGDYTVVTDMDVPEGTVVEFRCPKCEAGLAIPLECKLCKAPMVSLNLAQGGYVEFCSRRGCKGHALGGIGDIDQMMNLMNRMFETPYD